MTFPIVAVVFVVMLLFPVIGSYVFYRRTKVDVLFIDANKTKDPRYFAKSFDEMITKAFEAYDGSGSLVLSRSGEQFYMATDALPETCDRIVVSLNDVFDTDGVQEFAREVYACGDALVREDCTLRALYAMGSASVGSRSFIDRWIDAEGVLSIYDDCDLGMSATSAQHLIVGRNCTFRRLYAPVIDVGTYSDAIEEPAPLEIVPFVSKEVVWGKRTINDDDADWDFDRENDAQEPRANVGEGPEESPKDNPEKEPSEDSEKELGSEFAREDGVVVGTVITSHNLKVLEDIIVAGDVRSHRSVRLCDRAMVFGNVFAENSVTIGDGCRVLGTIFCQGDVRIGDSAVIGTEGQERSIIARGKITFQCRARVYGYVSNENGGAIAPDEETGDYPEDRPERPIVVVPAEAKQLFTAMPSLEELETGNALFRKNDRVVATVLPFGATAVPRSAFYCCPKLSRVTLPATVERIDDFAFFGCTALTRIDLRGCTNLREIGASAFEGCTALESVLLPAGMTVVGEAAFRNCQALSAVWFFKPSALECIGTHAFMGCTALATINLPKSVTAIGMSAFYGCTALTTLRLPRGVEEIGPYFVAECTALRQLSLPRGLTEEEAVGLPTGITVTVRGIEDTASNHDAELEGGAA